MRHSGISLATLAVIASPVAAQFTNWVKGQVSTEICFWSQPRAAILRDVIYLDGGNIWWLPRMDDGTTGAQVDDSNLGGWILNYNLSTPFDSDTNITEILVQDKLTKARGGEGNSNSESPNFYDGAMLANDAEFFLYGGTYIRNTKNYQDPDADEVMEYQAYQYGPDKPAWDQGFKEPKLDDGVTRYIAYGGAVNAPSENKAWYFSGLTSPTRGEIYLNNLTAKAVNVSDTLIQLDMTEQLSEKWTNKTLPDDIKGRANPEVVWVPVGKEGILVVLGGVVYPEWAGTSHKSADESASKKQSPEFMSTIDIYDIANDEWYRQPTEDGPGTRTRGCAVVAAASDGSSFNIFYYGGFDGISPTEPFYDEVWALSLPSFTWTKINNGTEIHGRSGHKCFMPYPDQMMILGGYTPLSGTPIPCLDGGPVVLFNITSGEWLDKYDPAEYSDYGVHEKIQSQIGGDASGGATVTAPVPSGWATSALGDVFATTYDKAKITTYYPYQPATSTDRPNLDNPDDGSKKKGGSGLPKWVAPVLGVVLGLMFVTGCLVLFCLWRRRKIFKSRSSDAGTEDTGMRIVNWMRGQQVEKGPPTVTTSEDTGPKSPEMEEARVLGDSTPSGADTHSVAPVELHDTQLVELADTSPPVELHDTGLSPIEIIQKHSHVGQPKSRSVTNPSYSSFSAGADHASTVSRSTAANSNLPPPSSPEVTTPSSPSPASPTPRSNRMLSDVSGLSEHDASHLRQMSEGTLSLTSLREEPKFGSTANVPDTPGTDQMVVSPPTADEDTLGQDYISAKASSPSRKSVFKEEDDDMGKPK
ncbi:Fc.00g091520.m01.CDS01 [Cosmosporella sp. VM-42]